MADVTSTFNSLSSTESSNGPSGSANIGTGLDDNVRMLQALMAAWRDQTAWGIVTLTSVSGTNTITATLASAGSVTFGPTSLSAGMKFLLVPANTNTGATTLNITSPSGGSALGAKNVYANGAACVGGELVQSVPAIVEYDGTQFNILGFFGFSSLTSETSVATGDSVPLYDTSESGYNRATVENLVAGGAASQAEMESASATNRVVTPGRQTYHPGMAKAWVNFSISGGVVTVDASHNVTGVARNGAGDYTITWSITMSSADYCVQATAGAGNASHMYVSALTTTTTRVINSVSGAYSAADCDRVFVVIYGDI